MTTTVPASMLAEIQGWAPGGGFVRSEWRTRDQLTIGDLFRSDAGWAAISRLSVAVSFNSAHEVIDRSPVIGWLDQYGGTGRACLFACDAGREVRTETRLDPRSLVTRTGLDSFIVPGDMPGAACAMCGKDMLPGHAGWRDPDNWLLCLHCAAPAFAAVPA